ncbi:MAG: HDIG domain-containing protein [Bacteroidales bacterium]|nr:HDIG domain-containing protein [Bacteroidales bacterium]
MDRGQSLKLLKQYIKNDKMIAHCIASEAVLMAMANRLGANPDKWGLAGLLHDIDVEITNADMLTHGMEAVQILRENNIDEEVIEAIMLHNEDASHHTPRSTTFHYALAAGETITGLIFASALVIPSKKIADVKAKSVAKRMKEKAFAASVKRENIMECEKAGVPLDEFIELSLDALSKVSGEIGF